MSGISVDANNYRYNRYKEKIKKLNKSLSSSTPSPSQQQYINNITSPLRTVNPPQTTNNNNNRNVNNIIDDIVTPEIKPLPPTPSPKSKSKPAKKTSSLSSLSSLTLASKKFISSMSSSKPLPSPPVVTVTNVTTAANYDENVNNTTLTTTESSITSSQPIPIRGTKRKQIPPPSIPPPSIPPPPIPPPSIPPPLIPPPSIPIPPSIPPPSIPIPPPPILHIPPPPLSSFRKLPNNNDSYKRYMYGLGFNTMSSGANLSHMSLNRGFNNYYYRKSDTSGVSGVDEIIINENSIIIDDEGNYLSEIYNQHNSINSNTIIINHNAINYNKYSNSSLNSSNHSYIKSWLDSPTIPLTPTRDCSSMHSTSSTFLYHHNGSKTNLSNSMLASPNPLLKNKSSLTSSLFENYHYYHPQHGLDYINYYNDEQYYPDSKQSSILSSELYAPLFINNRLTAMYKAKKNKSMSDYGGGDCDCYDYCDCERGGDFIYVQIEGNGVVENGNNSDDDDVEREETINNDGCSESKESTNNDLVITDDDGGDDDDDGDGDDDGDDGDGGYDDDDGDGDDDDDGGDCDCDYLEIIDNVNDDDDYDGEEVDEQNTFYDKTRSRIIFNEAFGSTVFELITKNSLETHHENQKTLGNTI